MGALRFFIVLGLFVPLACGEDSAKQHSFTDGGSPRADAGAAPSTDSVLDAYLKERAVDNAFDCQCYLVGSAVDDCLEDASASPQLRACLAKAIGLAPAMVTASLSCITDVTRQYNDCMSKVKSCEDTEAAACDRAYEAQQFRCDDLPEESESAWYACKDQFDPNYAGPDD